ncbi:MAG TPA: response regulator [Steroidobacteraceae bacterium]|jgi:CheY-like chemotaxis protein|nr:response regulator [Steroidobacteraceae bacterium]
MIAPDSSVLDGVRILIVEDESLVCMWLEDVLSGFGCNVVGPASRLPRALELAANETIDAAILDINVAGEKVFPVADKLHERNIPFVFSTGYGTAGLPERYAQHTVLQKPYFEFKLQEELERLLNLS